MPLFSHPLERMHPPKELIDLVIANIYELRGRLERELDRREQHDSYLPGLPRDFARRRYVLDNITLDLYMSLSEYSPDQAGIDDLWSYADSLLQQRRVADKCADLVRTSLNEALRRYEPANCDSRSN